MLFYGVEWKLLNVLDWNIYIDLVYQYYPDLKAAECDGAAIELVDSYDIDGVPGYINYFQCN